MTCQMSPRTCARNGQACLLQFRQTGYLSGRECLSAAEFVRLVVLLAALSQHYTPSFARCSSMALRPPQ